MNKVYIVTQGTYGLSNKILKVFYEFHDAQDFVMDQLEGITFSFDCFGELNIYRYESSITPKTPYHYYSIESTEVK